MVRALKNINWKIALFIIIATAAMLTWSLSSLEIDTDVLSSLPSGDPVIDDARYIFENHPIQDQLAIDISVPEADPDLLVQEARVIKEKLLKSGLFTSAGTDEIQSTLPLIIDHVLNNLPILFSKDELHNSISPLLGKKQVRSALRGHIESLMNLDGVGLSGFMTRDPLGFSSPILKRLSGLAPSQEASLYRNHLISSDRKHLLLTARPAGSTMDSKISASLENLFESLQKEANIRTEGKITLTTVGAYRAALDNERAARSDTQKAVIFATLGIVVLLMLAFPRPLLGLLALIPALFGTASALFIFSLFHQSISVMALGFGGAIISITVDHGIAYMLFLDRPVDTHGHGAAREIRSIGLLATLTSVGAFTALNLSGFAILAQIGQFAALGIASSFIFVHLLFAPLFKVMPGAKTERNLPLQKIVTALALSGGTKKTAVAGILALTMLFFARPDFQMDLNSMNSVTRETLEAEEVIKNTWGNVFDRVYLMTEGPTIQEILKKNSGMSSLIKEDLKKSIFSSAFTPSMICPGPEEARKNFKAWKEFWTTSRIHTLRQNISIASAEFGFSSDAFSPLFTAITAKNHTLPEIPEKALSLLGISRKKEGQGYLTLVSVKPGQNYDSEKFFSRYSGLNDIKIFDPPHFSKKLGSLLSHTFIRMVIIIGVSVVVLLLFFYLDIRLTLISLLPIIFAMLCTLGILNLTGHTLGIPELMLSIVVIGMGIDYSLFMVRAAQRYGGMEHQGSGLIASAVFLASASTLIGFGVLIFADHVLLKSAGLTSFLGIGFSLAGAFAILPPLLQKTFQRTEAELTGANSVKEIRRLVQKRFAHLDAYARVFAWTKMRTDSMFNEIDRHVQNPGVVLDIGCGYGVPAAWILSQYSSTRYFALDPDFERARVCARITGERGWGRQGGAPDIPELPERPDTVLLLDMLHNLSDQDLTKTINALAEKVSEQAKIIIRVTVAGKKKIPWMRWIENVRLSIQRITPRYRSIDELTAMLGQAGFKTDTVEQSGREREEYWITAIQGGPGD